MSEVADAISITDVSKTFRVGIRKTKTAVEELSMTIAPGKVVGLLGPNGSGKSTTLKMILGFLRPTRGEILICGVPSEERRARALVGYLPENPKFQKFLTGKAILEYYGGLLGMQGADLNRRADELLTLVGLRHAAHERVGGYSKGMTQRLAIAQALLCSPPILIFDEPMSGLDPLGRYEIRQLIQRLHDQLPDATILFSTHILGDVEQLCSEVALLRKGRLASYCVIDELLQHNDERYDVILREVPEALQSRLRGSHKVDQRPIGLIVTIDTTPTFLSELTEFQKAGVKVVGISTHRRTLEEALFADPKAPPPQEVTQ